MTDIHAFHALQLLNNVNDQPRGQQESIMRVLHVTESMGSGVEAAILDYVRSSPKEIKHSLLYASRGYRTGGLQSAGLEYVVDAGQGAFSLARQMKSAVARVKPDIVHLHSSWAGLVGRSTSLGKRLAIVYSPHSFYFERTDLSAPARRFAYVAEKFFAKRTHVIAAVSPHEERRARELGAASVYVPHIAQVPDIRKSSAHGTMGLPRIVAVGRLSAQKDPDFFIEVKVSLDRRGVKADWLWVGGGDDDYQQRLEEAGVRVTGWLDRVEALRLVVDSAIYLHTAAWEGNPISLLEVEHLKVPAVVRSIPSVVSLGYSSHVVTAESMADEILARLEGKAGSFTPQLQGMEQQTVIQQKALREVYSTAISSSRRN